MILLRKLGCALYAIFQIDINGVNLLTLTLCLCILKIYQTHIFLHIFELESVLKHYVLTLLEEHSLAQETAVKALI